MNGDGIVGVNGNDPGGYGAGRAYVYDFNRYFVLSPNDDEVWNVGAGQSIAWLGAERANLGLSANGGATYELLKTDVGGGESNTVTLLVPHAPTRFARVKVTPAAALGFPATDLDVGLFDLSGRRVATLARGPRAAADGAITLRWDARGVGPGIYFVRAGAATAGWSDERKVLVIR